MSSKRLKKVLTLPLNYLFIFLFFGFLLFLALLFLLVWIPIYAWRLFAIFLTSKLLPKKFGRILNPMDLLSHVQNPVGASNASLVCTAVLQKDLNLDQVRELFSKSVLNRSVERGDKSILRYPELRQFEVDWLGFRFLKWDKQFHIDNHDVEVEKSAQGVMTISQVHTELLNREFDTQKSPWELVLFRGVVLDNGKEMNGSQTVLGLRISHTIADGLSLLKLFVECLGGKSLVKASRSIVERRRKEKIKLVLNFPFSIAIDSCQYWRDVLVHRGAGAALGVGVTSNSRGKLRRVVVGVSGKVRMEDVKNLTKMLGVTSSSVIMAGILGGFAKFVKKSGHGRGIKKAPMGYVLPVDGHPDGFANHWKTTYTLANLDTSSTPFSRIRRCNRSFLEMKCGTRADLLDSSIFFSGTCLTGLAGILLRNRICSFGITNIAGEEEGFFVGGTECVDFCLGTGGILGMGLMFCVMSYRGHFRISCVAEENERGNCQRIGAVSFSRISNVFQQL